MADDESRNAPTEKVPRWQATTAVSPPDAAQVERPPPPPAMPFEARFELGDELGRGGMGRVVAATDTLLDRQVAVKHALISDVDGLSRFQREATITAKLEHPSIVPIHDAGIDDRGQPFYIMRRIAGESLAHLVERARDAKARLGLVPNVLAAIDAAAFAHAAGIIHRDIKPWNIVVGAYGETLLIDWGLARAIVDPEADAEDRGSALGTAGYMAPEQVRGESLDARTDVYALGATLLHVLIGEPVISEAKTAWLVRVAQGERPPLGAIDPDVPVELVAIVAKAMDPDPDVRYRDGSELAGDLRAFLAGQLVAAHDYTVWQRFAKSVRRHRVAFATAALAGLAVIITGVLAIASVVRERDDATRARELADERAELMLVEQASALAPREPTRAVALLRRLPATSRYLLRARDIASVAAAHGIAHGKNAHAGPIRALAFAPGGEQLLSAAADGDLQIHDVRTGTSRTLLRGQTITTAVWTDRGTTITFGSARGVAVVDVRTARVQTIDPDAEVYDLWARADDRRVRYLDHTTKRVIERSTTGADPITVANEVTSAYNDDGRLLVSGGDSVRIIDAHGERVLARGNDVETRFAMLAISSDGTRAAASGVDEGVASVTEWNIATGDSTRFPLRGRNHFYAGSSLVVENPLRGSELETVIRARPAEAWREVGGEWSVMWMTPVLDGVGAVNHGGRLAFFDGLGTYEFPTHVAQARLIAGRRDSPYVAIGSDTGVVLWWDLRQMLPRHLPVRRGSVPCHLDPERLYLMDVESLSIVALPRRGGTEIRIPGVSGLCAGGVRDGSRFAVRTSDGYAIVDGATGHKTYIRGELWWITKEKTYYVRGTTLYELLPDGSERTWWKAPAAVRGLSSNDTEVIIALDDARVVWVDAKTGGVHVASLPVKADQIVGDRERFWIVSGSSIHIGERGRLREIARLDRRVTWIDIMPDGVAVVGTEDFAVWRVTPAGSVERRRVTLTPSFVKGGRRSGASVVNASLVGRTFLDTGERLELVTRRATAVMVDDRSLVVVRQDTDTMFDIYDDAVPADPARLHGWIDSATNAVLHPDSDEMQWR